MLPAQAAAPRFTRLGFFCVEGKTRDVQRWRDRHPDHDHGARVAHPGWYFVACVGARATGGPGLLAQLRVPGDLLEQPPPHAGGRLPGEWCGPVGQPAPALLAITDPVQYRLDERAPISIDPNRRLRDRPTRGRHRVFDPPDDAAPR